MPELQWPWILVAAPLPWLVFRLVRPAESDSNAALYIPFYRNLVEIDDATIADQSSTQHWRIVLAWTIWLLLLLSAARPVFVGDAVPLSGSGRDLMLAVDLSASMEMEDMIVEKKSVDRLVATKKVLDEFINKRRGDRLGLILFGSQAYLQAPLTFDLTTVRTLMNESVIGMAGNRTAIGDALGLAVKHLRKTPRENRVLILLTDGANTAGEISPVQAARLAAEENIKIYSIGLGATEVVQQGLFGTPFGARKFNPSADLDETTLLELAELTGGRYFRATNSEELTDIYQLLDRLEPIEQDELHVRPTKTLFYWPLLLALLLTLIPPLMQFLEDRRSPAGIGGDLT